MFWIYISILLLIIIVGISYRVRNIKVIRVFGLELMVFLLSLLLVVFVLGEVLLPIPQYYIKHGKNKEVSLNEVLEEELLRAGIEFDKVCFIW